MPFLRHITPRNIKEPQRRNFLTWYKLQKTTHSRFLSASPLGIYLAMEFSSLPPNYLLPVSPTQLKMGINRLGDHTINKEHLNNDSDCDGYKNVTRKVNSRRFKLHRSYSISINSSNVGTFFWS